MFLPNLSNDKHVTMFRIVFIAEIRRSWCSEKEISTFSMSNKQLKGWYALVHPREARCIVIWCYAVNLDHISLIYISLLRLDKYGSRHFWEALRSERFIVYLASPSRITTKITNDVKRAIKESNEDDILTLEVRNPSYMVKSGRIHRDLLAFDEKGSIACPTICCWNIVGGRRPQLDHSRIGYNEDGLYNEDKYCFRCNDGWLNYTFLPTILIHLRAVIPAKFWDS